MKTLNRRQYRDAVQAKREFKGASVFAVARADAYVVYSYGSHWPLFIYRDGTWYENGDKYSMTTSHHRGYCHPHCDTVTLSCAEMRALDAKAAA